MSVYVADMGKNRKIDRPPSIPLYPLLNLFPENVQESNMYSNRNPYPSFIATSLGTIKGPFNPWRTP